MYSFNQYLVETKNTHLAHLEEYIFDSGVNGTRRAINFLQDLRDMLAGHSKNKVDVTLKVDGAPAVFAGIDPTDGQFFVAKKGIFNKNPKVYKTPAEIEEDTSGDLQEKLLLALEYFPELGIKNIIQGDFMFSQKDLKVETIDDQKYITFHPNTIVYAVPFNSDLGRHIRKSKVGVVWHTSYTGNSFESLKGKFTENIMKTLRPSKNIWMQGALIHDLSGKATMTKGETEEVTKLLSHAGRIFKTIPKQLFDEFADNAELQTLTKTFINANVRSAKKINHHSASKDLYEFIFNKYKKEIDSKKTAASKENWATKRNEVTKVFTKYSSKQINNMFLLNNIISDAKLIIVDKMSKIGNLSTFLRTKNGFRVTGQEGFVAVDRIGNAIKLVDRLEFSLANFSPDIIKQWMR